MKKITINDIKISTGVTIITGDNPMHALRYASHSNYDDSFGKSPIETNDEERQELNDLINWIDDFKNSVYPGFFENSDTLELLIQIKRVANHILNGNGLSKSESTMMIEHQMSKIHNYQQHFDALSHAMAVISRYINIIFFSYDYTLIKWCEMRCDDDKFMIYDLHFSENSDNNSKDSSYTVYASTKIDELTESMVVKSYISFNDAVAQTKREGN